MMNRIFPNIYSTRNFNNFWCYPKPRKAEEFSICPFSIFFSFFFSFRIQEIVCSRRNICLTVQCIDTFVTVDIVSGQDIRLLIDNLIEMV